MTDFSPAISTIMQATSWLLPIILCAVICKSSWFKSLTGTAVVKLSARFRLPKDTYRALHNINLPTTGGSAKINHIFISNYGIFVVRIHNMKGGIFGGEQHAQWTQKTGKNFLKFQNPLHQNEENIKALQAMLAVPESALHSVIAFVGDNTFKTPMPENITRGSDYINYIKSFRKRVLSTNEVQIAFAEIESGHLKPSWKTQRQHIKQLQSRILKMN